MCFWSYLVGSLSIAILISFCIEEEVRDTFEYPSTLRQDGVESAELFRGLYGLEDEYDLIIVGAGLSGAVIAEQASKRSGFKSLVLDKRDHIGGNCFDYIDQHGIRVSKYGAHIFHTQSKRVWHYVQQFSQWMPYAHRVKGLVKDQYGQEKIVPVPPNQDTVNILFNANVTCEEEMDNWIRLRRPDLGGKDPKNGEEMSLSRVGSDLYEKIFKHYTKKQWDKYPAELDASVLARLPFRLNNNDRYFNDPWEGLPKDGYTKFFQNILLNDPKITVRLNMDYFKVKSKLPRHKLLIFTGPIDAFYASKGLKKLEYRSIYFETDYYETKSGFYQPAWMVNYPSPEVKWTRIAEYKHTPNQPDSGKKSPGTVIYREYSTDQGDPYYPVPNEKNRALYKQYQQLALQEPNVVFVGRLASYKYFNMDQAILTALELYDVLVKNGTLSEIN